MSQAEADLERSVSPLRPQPHALPPASANLLRFRARSASREASPPPEGRPGGQSEDYWADRSRLARIRFGEDSNYSPAQTAQVAADLLETDRETDRLFRIPQEEAFPPTRKQSQYPQLTSAFRPGGALQQVDDRLEDPATLSTQRMPFVHNRFFQDEFQGSKKRASQLGEEVPDEHEEGDRVYQYFQGDSPNRFTYEPLSFAPQDPLNLAVHRFSDDRPLLERSNVLLDSDRHQAASVSSKVLRIRREGVSAPLPAGPEVPPQH